MNRNRMRFSFPRVSTREKRMIAAGALIVMPAITWVFVLRPTLSGIMDGRRTLAVERAALLKQKSVVDAVDETRAASRAVVTAIAGELDSLFSWTRADGGPVAAVSDIELWVETAAAEADVWIDNIEAVTDSLAAARVLAPVIVRVAARSTPSSAARFFGLLERGERLVRIERVRLLALPDGSMPPGNVAFEADVMTFMVSSAGLDELAAR